MFKKILFLCLNSVAYAQIPTSSVNNFNLNYRDPSGVANTEHLIVPGYSFMNSTSFTVEQQAGNLDETNATYGSSEDALVIQLDQDGNL